MTNLVEVNLMPFKKIFQLWPLSAVFKTGCARLGLCSVAFAVAFGSVSVSAQMAAQQGPQLDLARIKLSAGMHLIAVQVAATPEQRQIGLMLRKEMPQQEGMLFVFEEPSQQCFWMKDTLLPLTAAFVADDGRIVNLVNMTPQTLNAHCSREPVRYVLEMNQGWFTKKGIKAGTKLTGDLFQRNR